MFGTSMQSLSCGITSTALSVALLPVVCWHISVALLCRASAMACAFPERDVHPGPLSKGAPQAS